MNIEPAAPTTIDRILLRVTVKNVGNGQSYRAFLGIKVGGRSKYETFLIPALGINRSKLYKYYFQIKKTGTYRVDAIADYTHKLQSEFYRDNNSRHIIFKVEKPNPCYNLKLGYVTWKPHDQKARNPKYPPNTKIVFTARISNYQGPGHSPPCSVLILIGKYPVQITGFPSLAPYDRYVDRKSGLINSRDIIRANFNDLQRNDPFRKEYVLPLTARIITPKMPKGCPPSGHLTQPKNMIFRIYK